MTRPGTTTELTALVVEGGAMRCVFSSGVLDAFLESGFNPFDLCIGVSAGATNIAAYLAGMHGRNYTVYTDYSLRSEFISVRRFLTGGHLMDLDWLWEITIKELRLDIEAILNSRSRSYMTLTRVADGQAVYAVPGRDNLEQMLKASSAMPVFYRNFVPVAGVDGSRPEDGALSDLYVDGGIADPIPVLEAYRRGAVRILVLRSRPRNYRMQRRRLNVMMRIALRHYPQLRACLHDRPARYNRALDFMRHPPTGVQVIEVNPPEEFESSRLTKDPEVLTRDYRRGLELGAAVAEHWPHAPAAGRR